MSPAPEHLKGTGGFPGLRGCDVEYRQLNQLQGELRILQSDAFSLVFPGVFSATDQTQDSEGQTRGTTARNIHEVEVNIHEFEVELG
jgi:hypothetical protein